MGNPYLQIGEVKFWGGREKEERSEAGREGGKERERREDGREGGRKGRREGIRDGLSLWGRDRLLYAVIECLIQEFK